MLFEDKLSDIIRTLEMDGVLLHPSEIGWSLSCSIHSEKACSKIARLAQRSSFDSFTVLVDSLESLKVHVPHIHPRIETLLLYHTQPLIVQFPKPKLLPEFLINGRNTVPFRIVNDPYNTLLIHLLGHPIASVSAGFDSFNYPHKLDAVPSSIMKAVDFISLHKSNTILDKSQCSSVVISYDQDGELTFIHS